MVLVSILPLICGVLIAAHSGKAQFVTNRLAALHAAQAKELDTEREATTLFEQLRNKFDDAHLATKNSSLVLATVNSIMASVERVEDVNRKLATEAVDGALSEMERAVAKLALAVNLSNSSMAKQAKMEIESSSTQVQSAIDVLHQQNKHELKALHRSYSRARHMDKSSGKSMARTARKAAVRWKRASMHTKKAATHADFWGEVQEEHFQNVEQASEGLKEEVETLGEGLQRMSERFFATVEMNVEAQMHNLRNRFATKRSFYAETLMHLWDRILQLQQEAQSLRQNVSNFSLPPPHVATNLLQELKVGGPYPGFYEEVHAGRPERTTNVATSTSHESHGTEEDAGEAEEKSKAQAMDRLSALRSYEQDMKVVLNRSQVARTTAQIINKAEAPVRQERIQLIDHFEGHVEATA